MRRTWIVTCITFILLVVGAVAGSGQTLPTVFTYQGQLKDGGTGVNAPTARFLFRLWDAETGGTQVATESGAYPVVVTDGIFTTTIDFGASAFTGPARWLEIGVDVTGGTTYTWLAPRQRLTSAPTALYAPPWILDDQGIYYTAGRVGIGTDAAAYQLDVDATGVTRAVSGTNRDASGTKIGVYGEAVSSDGRGVQGYAGNTSGAVRGVYGFVRSPNGFGVYGANTASTGNGVGVYGEASSSTGYAGYFAGRGYFGGALGIGIASPTAQLDVAGTVKATGLQITTAPQTGYVLTSDANGVGSWQAPVAGSIGGSGTPYYLARFTGPTTLGSSVVYESTGGNVGIGTSAPSTKLHVAGTVRTDGFQLSNAPHAGYVLTSDATGMGSWQATTGFSLPYTGSVSATTAAFQITNTGTSATSHAVSGVISGASSSSQAAAGYFNAVGSRSKGVLATSDNGPAVQADFTGASGEAISASSSGTGGANVSCSLLGGFAVKGVASATGTSTTTRGGWFESAAAQGQGLYAKATGNFANAIVAEATAGEATAIYGNAPGTSGTGLVAKGGNRAAAFYGNVQIYEYGTNNKVIELGKGLDYAEGFDVSDDPSEVPAGTVLVIDPENPGRLERSQRAYDRRVAGIVAGANGLGSGVRLGTGQFDRDVALAGRVYCNVVALGEDIQPGDMLTTSETPGYAMKVRDRDRAQGAILGKAMEPLAAGHRGQILVLVTLQ